MSQITLRKIPARVEKQLRIQARKSGLSLSKTALSLISKALGTQESNCSKRKRDLSSFLGTMSAEELKAFALNTASFSQIDSEM